MTVSPKFEKIDKLTIDWLNQVLAKKLPVSGIMIREMTKEFAEGMNSKHRMVGCKNSKYGIVYRLQTCMENQAVYHNNLLTNFLKNCPKLSLVTMPNISQIVMKPVLSIAQSQKHQFAKKVRSVTVASNRRSD